MSYTPSDIHAKLAAVAPISGISIGDYSDKSTWEVVYLDSATDEQKAAAQAIIDGVTPPLVEAHKSLTPLEFYNRLTDEEVSALDASTDATVSAWRARLPYCHMIEIDTEQSMGMQAYLVSIGLFTSERIAEIFQ